MAPSRTYHHGNLQAALVDSAALLIEEQGPGALSLREVARRVGVSHAAPYRHFRGKRDLLEAVAIRGFEDLTAALDAVIAAHPNDARRQFEDGGAAYVLEAVNLPRRTQLMFSSVLGEPQPSPGLQTAAEAGFARCVAIVRNGQAQGVFRQGSTREMVLAFWSAAHGLAMLLVANQLGIGTTNPDPHALWDGVAIHLLEGMLELD